LFLCNTVVMGKLAMWIISGGGMIDISRRGERAVLEMDDWCGFPTKSWPFERYDFDTHSS
jgi:hypothetical protein